MDVDSTGEGEGEGEGRAVQQGTKAGEDQSTAHDSVVGRFRSSPSSRRPRRTGARETSRSGVERTLIRRSTGKCLSATQRHLHAFSFLLISFAEKTFDTRIFNSCAEGTEFHYKYVSNYRSLYYYPKLFF